MATKEQMLRYKHIVNLLKSKLDGVTFEQIREYLHEKDVLGSIDYVQKTFTRDKNLIQDIFDVEITYSRSSGRYRLEMSEMGRGGYNIYESVLMIDAYKKSKEYMDFVHYEDRIPLGSTYFEGIVYAIREGYMISFEYSKFWDEPGKSRRVVQPFALKQFKSRWYLIAKEMSHYGEMKMKTFGLDRITAMEISTKTFRWLPIGVNDMFINSFGIVSTLDMEPEEVILSFTPEQGRYIKTFKLHHSQKILVDNEEEFRVSLWLVPTYDFYQELLSYGNQVRVISPNSVKETMKDKIQSMLKNYEE